MPAYSKMMFCYCFSFWTEKAFFLYYLHSLKFCLLLNIGLSKRDHDWYSYLISLVICVRIIY